jgi:Zn-dependent protease with chaperone function
MTDTLALSHVLTTQSDPGTRTDGFAGFYYDGVRSRRHGLVLRITPQGLSLHTAEWVRSLTAADILPIDSHAQGVLFLPLQDGSTCELPASIPLRDQLRAAGVAVKPNAALTHALHADWRLAALALAFLAAAVAAFYVWLLPSATEMAVAMIPDTYQQQLGGSIIKQLDGGGFLYPSKLPEAQRAAIGGRFDALVRELDPKAAQNFHLYIRHADIGPNAFALPGSSIVLTDELVTLLDGDLDALSGVLAHELGHARHQHGLRNVIQSSALTLLGSALIGDYSGALAAVPAALAHLRYSRAFETEADVFAHDVLCHQRLDPARTAVFFDRLQAKKDYAGNLLPEYLMTHPSSDRRAAFFRTPC